MTIQHKKYLKRFTYICLTLSSIILPPQVQAGGGHSKVSPVPMENLYNDPKHTRPQSIQEEVGDGEGFVSAATRLKLRMKDEAGFMDRLFDKVLYIGISFLSPKMSEEEKKALIKKIDAIFET